MTFFCHRTAAWLASALVLAGCQHAPVPLVDAQAPAYAVPGAQVSASSAASKPLPTPGRAPASTSATAASPWAAPEPSSAPTVPAAATATPGLPVLVPLDAPTLPFEPGPALWSPSSGTPEVGIASWYGPRFHGRRTASGEAFDMNDFSAAHRQLPLGSYARVLNPANGRLVLVRINDRGPFVKGRIIDLSHAAAVHLGVTQRPQKVEVYALAPDALRPATPVVKASQAPVRKSTRRRIRTL